MVQFWRSGRMSSSRSLKLLVIAMVTYAISIQFKLAFPTKYPTSRYDLQSTFEVPGARRWKSARSQSDDQRRDSTNVEQLIVENSKEDRNLVTHLRVDRASQHDDSSGGSPKLKQTSPSRRMPRIIAIEYASGIISVMPLKVTNQSTVFKKNSMPEEGPKIEPTWYQPNAVDFIDGYNMDVCIPMDDWQLKSYPNCNKFHELDLQQLRMINKGGSRIAFELRQHLEGGEEAQFVYKTVKYTKEITMKLVEEQRKDSLVLERTSASQFIPDIHGYCSLGVMMDFMPEGNMHDYIKGSRLAGGSTLPPVDRLRLAIHIATSVADLHTIDGTPMPSIFHNDICCHQYLFQNGVFKLNDFNYARPIYINKKTNEQCTRTSFGMGMWKARSLEELQRALGHPDSGPVKPDKIDVWMMGNLIYYMLTDLYTFEKPKNLSWQDSGKELIAGRRTPYPKDIEKSKDPSHVAVKKALDMCWTQKWKERPSARLISDYLIGQLKKITGEEKPDLRVVLPKRNPNQRSTESDYDKYND
mmetsp:Transcript_20126/g.36377  ORF Transcript_20126/g.36377 Transcript_20126/m.36377 type:complete len:527 (+) Transcript_20126:219-1799(+)